MDKEEAYEIHYICISYQRQQVGQEQLGQVQNRRQEHPQPHLHQEKQGSQWVIFDLLGFLVTLAGGGGSGSCSSEYCVTFRELLIPSVNLRYNNVDSSYTS